MPYRDSYSGSAFLGPRLTPWVTRLLIALTAVFLALFIADDILHVGVTQWLVWSPPAALRQPWSVLTFPFIHRDILTTLFTLLTLYFFGGALESHWGGRGFLRFCAVSAAGAVVLSTLLYLMRLPMGLMPVLGFTGAIYGMLLAFAVLWPEMEINIWGVIPVKAKWLALFSAVIGFILSVQNAGYGLAHLGAFGSAYLFLRSPWAPRAWGDLPPKRTPARKPQRAVVPWAAKKESPAQTAAPRPTAAAVTRRSARAEKDLLDDVDRILDKISAQGLSSLTEEERKRLDEVSRRYRTN
ncbi:MAG TPA: rhomboid family intramembrane serine protease [Longimicrobiaceae bacterium]